MRLGVYLHGSSPFSPKESVDEYIQLANHYENAGVHSLWFADHLIRTPDPHQTALFESWSLIAGLSRETSSIHFGTMVSPITFRKFGPFAKQLVTVDHLSGGRIIAGLGAGWSFKEYGMFGIDFPSASDRLIALEETVDALQQLFTQNNVSYDGRFVTLNDAYLNPKPVREDIPILIGGGGEQVTLKLVAKYAKHSNFGGTLDTIEHKLSVLVDHCDSVGRLFDEIEPTSNRALILGRTQEGVDQAIQSYRDRFIEVGRSPPSRDNFADTRLVGTVDEVVQQLGLLADLGIDFVVLTINDENSTNMVPELLDQL